MGGVPEIGFVGGGGAGGGTPSSYSLTLFHQEESQLSAEGLSNYFYTKRAGFALYVEGGHLDPDGAIAKPLTMIGTLYVYKEPEYSAYPHASASFQQEIYFDANGVPTGVSAVDSKFLGFGVASGNGRVWDNIPSAAVGQGKWGLRWPMWEISGSQFRFFGQNWIRLLKVSGP